MSEIKQENNQFEIKQENNHPPKYQELNDFELEVVCGGVRQVCNTDDECLNPWTGEWVPMK